MALGLSNEIIDYKEFCERDDKLTEVLSHYHDSESNDYRPALTHVIKNVLTGIL